MLNAMNRKELNETISFILDNIDSSRIVMNSVASIRHQLIDLTIEEQVISEQDFYKISSVLSTQSRSPLWENYFIKKHDCERVSKNENRGDLKKNGRYYEYKSSGYNQNNSVIVDPENKFTFSEIYVSLYDYDLFNRFTQMRA